jgi:P27 family predicted phage terminase small subunit
MNAATKKIFNRVKSNVEGLGVYSTIDELELERLANAMEVNRRAFKEVSKQDFSKLDKAYTQSSVYVTWKETTNIIKDLSDKFGLTPYGRKRLGKMQEVKKEANPLDNFIE